MFALILLLLTGTVLAAGVELTNDASGVWLNLRMDLLEDPSGRLTIDDVRQSPQAEHFRPAHGLTGVGYSPNPWWQRIDLQRSGAPHDGWWLVVEAVNLRDLRIYLPDGEGRYREYLSGEQVSFAAGRDCEYRLPAFRLPDGAGPLRVYLRTLDPAGNSFPMRIWSHEELQEYRIEQNLWLGMLYGLIGALLLYNLFLFANLQDRLYFLYVLATATGLLYCLGVTGHGFKYLWSGGAVPWWLDWITLAAAAGICVIAFTQRLLQTSRHARRIHVLLNLGCLLYLTAIVLDALDFRGAAAQLLIAVIPGVVPVALGGAAMRWRHGTCPAMLPMFASGLLLGSIGASLTAIPGLLQSTSAGVWLPALSIALQALLFSFALSSRISDLKRERDHAEQQASAEKTARLTLMRSARNELAKAVAVRTAELALSNEELREREVQLRQAAHCDPLTGLPNRRHLVEQAEQALDQAHHQEESVVLMLIDLDYFKLINDRHGHDAGDFLLQSIGQRLRQCVRASDCVARLGGDEFAVLVCGPDAEVQACEIAARLLGELARPVQFEQIEMRVSPSIGMAVYPRHARQFGRLFKAADQALYKVKGDGRAGYALAEDSGEPRDPGDLQASAADPLGQQR